MTIPVNILAHGSCPGFFCLRVGSACAVLASHPYLYMMTRTIWGCQRYRWSSFNAPSKVKVSVHRDDEINRNLWKGASLLRVFGLCRSGESSILVYDDSYSTEPYLGMSALPVV